MLIDFSQKLLWLNLLQIPLSPFLWNVIGRTQYQTKFLTNYFKGNKLHACYAIFVWVFTQSLIRDFVYGLVILNQPQVGFMSSLPFKLAGVISNLIGWTFTLSSMYRLGITGTYLGDYCGILMKERVKGFPYNVSDDPMYVGSTLNFLGAALLSSSPAGLFLTGVVYCSYQIAIQFEGPFTSKIYQNASKDSSSSSETTPASPSKKKAKKDD